MCDSLMTIARVLGRRGLVFRGVPALVGTGATIVGKLSEEGEKERDGCPGKHHRSASWMKCCPTWNCPGLSSKIETMKSDCTEHGMMVKGMVVSIWSRTWSNCIGSIVIGVLLPLRSCGLPEVHGGSDVVGSGSDEIDVEEDCGFGEVNISLQHNERDEVICRNPCVLVESSVQPGEVEDVMLRQEEEEEVPVEDLRLELERIMAATTRNIALGRKS
eukprot:s4270_g6.t1